MKYLLLSFIFSTAMAASASAGATVLFNDDFDSEALALNASLSNWTVSSGTVDVIGSGFFDFYPGNGHYLDLDGSTRNAGRISTQTTFSLTPGMTYLLDFDLGGSTRGDTNSVRVSLGNYHEIFTLASDAGLQHVTRAITVLGDVSSRLTFHHAGGDNRGLILDNVNVSAVPEPSTYALLLAGLGLIGFSVRRRAPR
jgi:hypothetical protein